MTGEEGLVRPYAITGGRTGSDAVEIHLESMVEITDRGLRDSGRYRWEAALVLDMCRSAIGFAELAAKMNVPIGVARVIVSDLCREGVVFVHKPADTRSASYAVLLERVLEGIRQL